MGMGNKAALASVFIAAVLVASVFAADNPALGQGKGEGKEKDSGNGYFLQAKEQHLDCRIDFTATVITDISTAVPSAAAQLSAVKDRLAADKAHLSTLSAGNNSQAIDAFAKGQLTADMKAAADALSLARKDYGQYNVTNATRTGLKSKYDAARAAMASCKDASTGALLKARINQFSDDIAKWDEKITALGKNGYGTTALQAVSSGAKASVVAPMQSALSSGDVSQMNTAVKAYCLGDGCGAKDANITPYDYHGYAKMALETLQATISKVESRNNTLNLSVNSSKLDEAKAKLGTVRSALSQAGTGRYGTGQDTQIWESLQTAQKDIREYAQEMKQAMDAKRQQMQAERAARQGNMSRNFTGQGNRTLNRNFTGQSMGNRTGRNFNGQGNGFPRANGSGMPRGPQRNNSNSGGAPPALPEGGYN